MAIHCFSIQIVGVSYRAMLFRVGMMADFHRALSRLQNTMFKNQKNVYTWLEIVNRMYRRWLVDHCSNWQFF